MASSLSQLVSKLYSRYRGSTLLKSSAWYIVAAVFQRGVNFLAVIVFTRLLTTDEYGSFAIFISWMTLFSTIITLNVYAAIARMKYDTDAQAFTRSLSAVVSLGTGTGLLATLVLIVMPDAALNTIFALPKSYLILAALAATAELPLNAVLSVWQVEYQYKLRSYVQLGITIAKILLPVVFILLPLALWSGDNALARIWGTSLVSFSVGIFFFAQKLSEGKTLFDRKAWRFAIIYSVPLIPHLLSGLILAQFDRVLIDRTVGREAAGLYSFAYQVGEITSLLWYATNAAWVPWFFEQMSRKAYGIIRQRSTQYLMGFAALTVVSVITAPLLVVLFSPQQYWITRAISPVIAASNFFTLLYSFYANVEFYENRTLYISIGTALAAVVNIVLNLILLPIYGYEVAIWTTMIAYILLFLFHAAIVRFRLRSPAMFNFPLLVAVGTGIALFSIVVFFVVGH